VSAVVRQATLAFWRATLLDDASARAWLDGAGLTPLLGRADRFERR
jgi:hypothetical protein